MSNDPNDDATVAFDGKSSEEPIQIPGYRILRQLGHGGMGAVYLAEDTSLGRTVAIKVVADAIARDASVRARFLREARLLATVEHPNVVRVYSFGASEERAYLVMEYVEGETLADRIRRGPMGIDEATEIICRVADALDAAWEKRIVHRDIKPSNILFDRKGNLKVADFGLAKGSESADTESSLTQTGYLLGSPHYIAPEQAQGHEADFRADIYSLGVTLFEMLTGRKPFEGGSALTIVSKHLHEEMPLLTSLRREAPSGVVRLVSWMTAKEPARRPSSYRELIDAVKQLDVPPVARQERRAVKWPLIALGVILAVVAIALAFAIRSSSAPAPAPADESHLVVAVAPFWGPDKDSEAEGRTMAALIQQAVGTRLGSAAKVIGIDETKTAVRDVDSARALGERLGASAVIWGQAFALHNEREIQPSVTLISRKAATDGERIGINIADRTEIRAELPGALDAIRVQSQSANQIELRKTSAEGIGDLVTFVAAMHALNQNDTPRALELVAQMRRTPDALYQRAVCFAQMKRDDDAMRELRAAVAADAAHAPALALMADIDARAGRFADAAAHLSAAAATGRRFTSSEAALYGNVLYVTERYVTKGTPQAVPTLLAIDSATSHVTRRWELPGVPQSYAVDDTGRPSATTSARPARASWRRSILRTARSTVRRCRTRSSIHVSVV
jgi:Serine/threonine protein kinase